MAFTDTLPQIKLPELLQGLLPGIPAVPQPPPLPYKINPDLTRKIQSEIKSDRWNGVGKNGVFRYSFSVAKAASDGTTLPTKATVPGFNDTTFFLRIPPQNITISTQFATNVSATNRGILEEHNGVVFRLINISGTTGVFPDRLVVGQNKSSNKAVNVVKNIFPNAFNSVTSAINSFNDIASAVTGPPPRELSPEDEENNPDFQKTGYHQFWVLHNFIVAYAEAKKQVGSNDLRFLFNSPKDNISYVCTPMSFDLKRISDQPLLYNYTIVLKCWDIAPISAAVDTAIDVLAGVPTPDNVAAAKAATEVLRTSRNTINAARNVLNGVHSDIANIMNIYTQGVLVMKDFVGLADEVADFPQQVENNANTLLVGPTNSFISALNESPDRQSLGFDSVDESQSNQTSATTKSAISSAASASASGVAAQVPVGQAAQAAEGLATAEAAIDKSASRSSKTTPDGETVPPPQSVNAQNAAGRLSLEIDNEDFASRSLDEFQDNISEEFRTDVESARDEAFQLTSGDIRELVDNLQEVSDNFAESIGGGDENYSAAFSLPAPAETDREPTEDDIINQAAIQEAAANFSSTLGTGQFFAEREADPFVNANINLDVNDQMLSPLSTIPVPFQRGSSLEIMAQQFLGDPNRAREIHILNNLRPPFIDEVGFTVPLSNASGRTFVVEDATNLTIGQAITIKGTGVSPTRRRILNLEKFGVTQTRVTIDGPDNLDIFTPVTNPFLEARLPGTVGPGDTVLIPDQTQPNTGIPTRPNEIEERLAFAEKVFKTDLLLDKNAKDVIVGANGDIGRSFGYNNALQALRLAVEIERGELEQHPDFGLSVPIGGRNSDIGLQDINDIVANTVTADPRFSDAITEVEIDGSISRIRIDAEGAAGTGQIPVEFEVGQL